MPLQGRSRAGPITLPVGGGLVVDEVEQELAESVGTSGLNVRFRDGYLRKTEGYDAVLNTPSAAALHVAVLQTDTTNFWIHATQTALFADDGTTKTNITGTALTGSLSSKFNSCVLGGVLVINNEADIPQYWGGTGIAANLTAWDSTWRCKSLRAFKNYLVALNITKSGTNYASMVKWSHAAAPGFLPDSWDETDATRDAGELDVAETDDEIVDGLALGNVFIVYKERSAYGMQASQGVEVFRVFKLPGNYGILAKNCVADTPVGHVVLTSGPDVVVHYANEPRSIVTGKWKQWLRDNIDSANYANAFVAANTPKSEVWICVPTTGSTYCDRALVWNYEEDTFALIAIPNLTHATIGLYQRAGGAWSSSAGATWADVEGPWNRFDVSGRLMASSADAKLYLMDEGETADGSTISVSWERVGLSFGDPEAVKLIKRVVPRVDATAGTVLTISTASSNDAEGPYTYGTGFTYTVGTSREANFTASGRFVGIKITSATANAWRVKSVGIDVVPMWNY